jgi:osmotically-inducible protein OsmY
MRTRERECGHNHHRISANIVTTTEGDVALQGFVNSKETEDRLVTKTREILGVKSVKSLLRVEEKSRGVFRESTPHLS